MTRKNIKKQTYIIYLVSVFILFFSLVVVFPLGFSDCGSGYLSHFVTDH